MGGGERDQLSQNLWRCRMRLGTVDSSVVSRVGNAGGSGWGEEV